MGLKLSSVFLLTKNSDHENKPGRSLWLVLQYLEFFCWFMAVLGIWLSPGGQADEHMITLSFSRKEERVSLGRGTMLQSHQNL